MKKQPKPILIAPPNAEIWTLDEVAAYMRINKRTLFRRIEDKSVPAFKIGGVWRFRKEAITNLMNEEKP